MNTDLSAMFMGYGYSWNLIEILDYKYGRARGLYRYQSIKEAQGCEISFRILFVFKDI